MVQKWDLNWLSHYYSLPQNQEGMGKSGFWHLWDASLWKFLRRVVELHSRKSRIRWGQNSICWYTSMEYMESQECFYLWQLQLSTRGHCWAAESMLQEYKARPPYIEYKLRVRMNERSSRLTLPSNEIVKINVDGAVRTGKATVEVIAKDHNGKVLAALAKSVQHITSVATLEGHTIFQEYVLTHRMG